jgi:hypothetical protein
MSIIRSAILGLLSMFAICITGCERKHYPSPKEIDSFFQEYGSLSDRQLRIDHLKKFLQRLNSPDSVMEDQYLEYFVNALTQEFLKTEDEAILVAVDETKIDAGFANYICEFYGNVKDTKAFRARYRSDNEAKKALRRCAGISFSEAEINEIEGGK